MGLDGRHRRFRQAGAVRALLVPLLAAMLGCNGATVGGSIERKLSVDPTTLDFGTLAPGLTGIKHVTLSNTGRTAVSVQAFRVIDDPDGVFTVNTQPAALGAGLSMDISVSFLAPIAVGAFSGFLEIDSGADNAPALLVRLTAMVGASCDRVSCPEHSTCVVTANGPTCTCDQGYRMQDSACLDNNPCSKNNGGCDPHAICSNTAGSVACTCKDGYIGNGQTGTSLVCTPINPCSVNNGGCDPNATCAPDGDSVSCTCNDGFVGNGQTGTAVVCSPLNRCSIDNGGCDPHAICTPNGTDVTCTCMQGYVDNGMTGSALVCTPVDPCMVNNGGCDPHATCAFNGHAVFCTCNPGYGGDGQTGTGLVCQQLDLCARNNGGCDPNATCQANGNTVACTCKQGYQGNGQTGTALVCTQINLCATNNGGCDPHATCSSDGLTVSCTCNLGYQGNGQTGTALMCSTVDLCLTNNGGCDPNATCTPNGTSVTCTCNQGYQGNGQTGTGLICSPIVDPCSVNNGGCNPSALCVRVGNGVTCKCPPCTTANGKAGPSLVCKPPPTPTCPVSPGSPMVPPAMSFNHVCDIDQSGALWCWGDNSSGQLGNGTQVNQTTPMVVSDGASWKAIAVGHAHTCGVQTDGSLWCWGDNSAGELGLGSASSSMPTLAPQQLMVPGMWTTVSAGMNSTCGIQSDGSLWCWGDNSHGQAGNSVNNPSAISSPSQVPTASGNTWTSVSCGTNFACGIQSDGSLWCWGSNAGGELGSGSATTLNSPAPMRVGTATYLSIAAGPNYACGLQPDHSLWCWGANLIETFGTGSSSGADTVPVPINPGTAWTAIAVNVAACGIQMNGSLWCTGPNDYANVGTGDQTSRMAFVQVDPGGPGWAMIAVGNSTTCGVTEGMMSKFMCWGLDNLGQVGDGVPTPDVPTQVAPGTTWKSIALGLVRPGNLQIGNMAAEWSLGDWSAAFGVRTNGTLWEWGGFAPYNLALWERQTYAPYDASQLMTEAPTQLGSGTNWTTVAAGDPVACALDSSQSLACFGTTDVGNGTSTFSASPVPLGGAWSAATVGFFNTCAIQKTGSYSCWGSNADGEFGDGTMAGTTSPERIGTGNWMFTAWSALSMGATHACGIEQANASLWCWGRNTGGELGNGTTTDSVLPQAVPGTPWVTVSAGFSHTCGRRPDGSLWCWGQNAAGEVGIGTMMAAAQPSQVPGNWSAVATSGHSATTCGIQANGSLWCWGSLAPITPDLQLAPHQLGMGSSWLSVAVSGNASGADGLANDVTVCAIRADSTLWCWGDNTFGQRGDTNAWRVTPVKVF